MRKRRIAKWVGLTACASVLSLSAASFVRGIGYVHPSCDVLIINGVLEILNPSVHTPGGNPAGFWVFDVLTTSIGGPTVIPDSFRLPTSLPGVISVPLGLPLILLGLALGVLWWSDRRRHPPNHCRACGYNLTGNVSGTCSECGAPIAQEGDTT